MEMETPALHSHAELRYEQFYGVMESKDFFIFYITMNQASLIRKKDVIEFMWFTSFLLERADSIYVIYRIGIGVDCEMSQKI